MDLRSHLSKARGLGAAHEGAHHWWMQRVTAIALIPLTFWFVSSVIKATGYHGIEGVMFLLASPFNAIAMILFLGTAIYHGTLGIKVIIEDYVHCPCSSKALDISTKFIAVVTIVAVTFAIFFVHLKTYEGAEKYMAGMLNGKKYYCHKKINSNIEGEVVDPLKNSNEASTPEQSDTGKAPITVIESPQE